MTPEKKRKRSDEAPDLVKRAHEVVTRISRACQNENGFGGFSISLYDTAWLSMITKFDADGAPQWLFPESFNYILDQQHDDGSWGTYASPVDGILNTMAGLLCLLAHRDASITMHSTGVDLKSINYDWKISQATTVVSEALKMWDVKSTLHVGFEILVPSLLNQLSERGVNLEFPARPELMKLYERKLAHFRPEMVTSKYQTTLLHSLEGLIGKVNFDQLSHHCTGYGGMLGSPASTAAYLINSTQWDDSAEKYLRNVIQSYGGCGGVPSGFPTPVFEVSWTISTLLASGYSIKDLPYSDVKILTAYLRQLLHDQNGLLGFAPGFLCDADDTAQTVLALRHLGIEADPTPLVKQFEAADHFQTYKLERNPSFSANANILHALLAATKPSMYEPQIEKAVKFMLSIWDDGALKDKWNLASEYSEMLLSSALLRLLQAWSQGLLKKMPSELIAVRVPITLSQLFSRALTRQHENGSWGNSIERTAYSALLLASMLKLPWLQSIRDFAQTALLRARQYLTLHANNWADGDYIWIEKVSYRLPILSEAYSLAAMRAPTEEIAWSTEVVNIFAMSEKKLVKMSKFFGSLPLFNQTSERTMLFAVAEAYLYTKLLKAVRLHIFPRDSMGMTEDKYLDFIPIAWTTVNSASNYPLSGKILWDMMVISMLNYQADEYMETVVANLPDSSLIELKVIIRAECGSELFYEHSFPSSRTGSRSPQSENSEDQLSPASVYEVGIVIQKYIRHVLQHPCVASTTEGAKKQVAEEINKFLLAHMAHNADNARMRAPNVATDGSVISRSYFDWVRTTGAHDTSCPYSFSFFGCLIGRDGSFGSSAKQRFFARALGLHLATMCRQYNDYGSQLRDAAERNLNSLDFIEFTEHMSGKLNSGKQDLMELAEFERECMQLCFTRLSAEISSSTAAQVLAFIDVTDLFGQIYVAQDIASRMQN
ncbi:Ent-kaurene synthase [Penicillium herquei]|nr:Ent-kaurene synthase [Penicillium herquei]